MTVVKNLTLKEFPTAEHRHRFNSFKMPFTKVPLIGGTKTVNLTAKVCLCGAVKITRTDWNNVALVAKEAILEVIESRLRQITKRKTIKARILL